jgi:secernin
VLSDHYEGSFLGGPAFNPARPDFHTLCMHEHPAGFTWGNTAASIVAVLPDNAQPYLWWASATPCTSIYLPVSVAGAELPEVLSTAGGQRGTGPNPENVKADTYTEDSYWWACQALLEAVAGAAAGSTYLERQPIVRARLDPMQERWSADVDAMAERATATDWQQLTARCTTEALGAVRELLEDFGDSRGRAVRGDLR